MSKPMNEPTVEPTKQTKSKRVKYSLSEKQDAELPSKITLSITQFTSDTSYAFEAVHGASHVHVKYIVTGRVTIRDGQDNEIQSMCPDLSLPQPSNWQGPKQRSLEISAHVPFATFRSNLSSGLNCWVHSHTGCEPVTSTRGLCHGKKSEQAGCIASTQPNSNEMCIAFQMMVNKHKHLIKNKTGSIFQLIVGFKANANLEITNGVIFDKVVSHRVNVAMKYGIDNDGNNPLQRRILPLIPTHVSNPIEVEGIP
jgi:hypothetical protein